MEIVAGIVVIAIVVWIIKTILENIGVILAIVGIVGALFVLGKVLSKEQGRELFLVLAKVFGAIAAAIGICAALGAGTVAAGGFVDNDGLLVSCLFGMGSNSSSMSWMIWGVYGAFLGIATGASMGFAATNRKWRGLAIGLVVSLIPFSCGSFASALRSPYPVLCREVCVHTVPFGLRQRADDGQSAVAVKVQALRDLNDQQVAATETLSRDMMRELRHARRPRSVIETDYEEKGRIADEKLVARRAELDAELSALRVQLAGADESARKGVDAAATGVCVDECVASRPPFAVLRCRLLATGPAGLAACDRDSSPRYGSASPPSPQSASDMVAHARPPATVAPAAVVSAYEPPKPCAISRARASGAPLADALRLLEHKGDKPADNSSYGAAIARAEAATSIDPGCAEAWSVLSYARYRFAYDICGRGDYTAAEAAGRRALELSPDPPVRAAALRNLGRIAAAQLRWPDAERNFTEALAIAPTNGEAKSWLSDLGVTKDVGTLQTAAIGKVMSGTLLTGSDVDGLTLDDTAILLNALLARHGRRLNSGPMDWYFYCDASPLQTRAALDPSSVRDPVAKGTVDWDNQKFLHTLRRELRAKTPTGDDGSGTSVEGESGMVQLRPTPPAESDDPPVATGAVAGAPSRRELSRSDVKAGMASIANEADVCFVGYHVNGKAVASVTVEGNGSVSKCEIQGGHMNTPMGRCLCKAVEDASFEKFSGPPMAVTWPFLHGTDTDGLLEP